MGIVKLIVPRHIYHRIYLPANADWRKHAVLGLFQILLFSGLGFFTATKWEFRSPRRGFELIDPNKKYSRVIPII
jgi:hypothetical protein